MAAKAGAHPVCEGEVAAAAGAVSPNLLSPMPIVVAGALGVLLIAVAPLRPWIAGNVTDRTALAANNVQSFMIQHLEWS
jgi:hypothetical protein